VGNLKKILLSLLVIGAVASVVSAGTYATYGAQVTEGGTFSAGTLTMTNVTGAGVAGSNCATSTTGSNCATLFSASTTALKPGGADRTNSLTIAYTGSLPTGAFGVYAAGYVSKGPGSNGAVCTASDPGAKIDLQILQGATVVYPASGSGYGTLKDFAATYNAPTSLLLLRGAGGSGPLGRWATNDSSTFTLKAHLDAGADPSYQKCESLADFVWYAAQ
jgi:hypothetical protein